MYEVIVVVDGRFGMVGPWDASGVSWSHNYMCGLCKAERMDRS